jgi:hypothetical protein
MIGWVALGLVAVVAAVVVATSKKAPVAAVPPKDLCLAALPEPFKADAQKIVSAGDDARMDSFAAQAESLGWKCAAKELRALAVECRRRQGLVFAAPDFSPSGTTPPPPVPGEVDAKKELAAVPALLEEYGKIGTRVVAMMTGDSGKSDVAKDSAALATDLDAFADKLHAQCFYKAATDVKAFAKLLREPVGHVSP